MKKLLSFVLVTIIICFSFTSCSEKVNTVLFMGVENSAGALDPQIVSDETASIIVRNCYEGLVALDSDGNIVPGAASDWKISADGLIYTFNLRKNVKWHLTSNAIEQLGEKLPENFAPEVTANDFIFALRRAVNPETKSPQNYLLYNIKNAQKIIDGKASVNKLGVKATDDYTLVITLEQPQNNLLEILTEPLCMPCNETFFNACTGRYGRYIKFILSNGPFYLSRLYETSYRINKNPDYHDAGSIVSEAVWLYANPDAASVRENLEKGDYSAAVLSEYEYAKTDISKKMSVTPISNVLRSFILNPSDDILSNVNIRKALLMATDNETAANDAKMTFTDGIVPSCASDMPVTSHPDAYDEKSARKCFDEGLKELGKANVVIEILCEESYEDMCRRLIQQWQRILGVDIGLSVKTCTSDELISAVKKGNYQIALASITAQTDSSYMYFSSFAKTSPYNKTGYSDEKIPSLLASLCSGSEAENTAVYKKIEKRLVNAGVIIPLWEENTYFVSYEAPERIALLTGRDKVYFR